MSPTGRWGPRIGSQESSQSIIWERAHVPDRSRGGLELASKMLSYLVLCYLWGRARVGDDPMGRTLHAASLGGSRLAGNTCWREGGRRRLGHLGQIGEGCMESQGRQVAVDDERPRRGAGRRREGGDLGHRASPARLLNLYFIYSPPILSKFSLAQKGSET
jgi:hypothetical protein